HLPGSQENRRLRIGLIPCTLIPPVNGLFEGDAPCARNPLMFIQTEATPNPATLKFLPGEPVLPGSTRDYRAAAEAEESPLAHRLFAVKGVSGVFLGQDFVTVTKSAGEWQQLKPAILGLIME